MRRPDMVNGTAFKVAFWGVRGSIAAPMTSQVFDTTIESLAEEYQKNSGPALEMNGFLNFLKEHRGKLVHGGNTSCVEVVSAYNGSRFILDMGTGLRPLGNALMKEMFERRGLDVTFLLSHVHWDHIQGLPFFAPLYMNKQLGIKNKWHFLGGTDWQRRSEECIAGQMDPPNFPVSWKEISAQTHSMDFSDVNDHYSVVKEGITVTARKLFHPQETYGWRLQQGNKSVVYATDNEPFDPRHPTPALVELSKGANLLIIDCQYSDEVYHGAKGPVRYGWGHSYPSAVAYAAAKARVENVALFHHDPDASRLDIESRVAETKSVLEELGHSCNVFAAWEGLEVSI